MCEICCQLSCYKAKAFDIQNVCVKSTSSLGMFKYIHIQFLTAISKVDTCTKTLWFTIYFHYFFWYHYLYKSFKSKKYWQKTSPKQVSQKKTHSSWFLNTNNFACLKLCPCLILSFLIYTQLALIYRKFSLQLNFTNF